MSLVFASCPPASTAPRTTLFRGSLHYPPATDEAWAQRSGFAADSRVLGAFSGDVLVGTALSNASDIVVPGGAALPMAMVTGVGVRVDHTRRGVLTALMRAQLTGSRSPSRRCAPARRPSTAGSATAWRRAAAPSCVDRQPRAAARRGTGRRHGPAAVLSEAEPLLPALYDRVASGRPGWDARPGRWWRMARVMLREREGPASPRSRCTPARTATTGSRSTSSTAASTGSACWPSTTCSPPPRTAWAGLWRFLLPSTWWPRSARSCAPLDEPLELLFADRRAVRTTEVEDETWLRLVDVPAALAAGPATFADAGSVVIEVRDDLLPANSGRYRIGDGPARPVDEPAELTMDVDALAMAYLGDVAPSALAAAGRARALSRPTRCGWPTTCSPPESPWCGTYF